MKKDFYITTPLYYVNDKPHIGHAYTTILCDAFARFHRLMGREVHFLTGTDEHGEKIDETAKKNGKSTQTHTDEMAACFKDVWALLDIQYDDFIRTTEERHKEVVTNVVRCLVSSGDIYKGAYEGWYCVPCESFWTKSQLADGTCPDCRRDVKHIREENYFFRLSKYQEWLSEYILENPDFIMPKGKRQEVLSFLKDPLEDLCISRPRARLSWGIPFPEDDDFVIYVWFDALLNYISAIKFSIDPNYFKAVWPAHIHMMAKDILRQHAVYWPIMLKALDVPMPKHVIAHGWWTIEGDKMSKSRGNVVDPVHMSKTYGVDTFRYYMLREANLGSDGAYSEELLIRRFNSDLANDLGNLVYRSLAMLAKYFNGVVPDLDRQSLEHPLRTQAEQLCGNLEKCMVQDFDPRCALSEIWALITAANKYIEDTKPWQLAKETTKSAELAVFMYILLETIRIVGVALTPFLPATGKKIVALLKEEIAGRDSLTHWGSLASGKTLEKGEPLFPKIEDE
jgi:methionyl-tRNA synthetase